MKLLKYFIPIIIFAFVGELLSYAYFFHRNSNATFGWEKIINKAKFLVKSKQLKFQLTKDGFDDKILWERFYNNDVSYMASVELKFDDIFEKFVSTADNLNVEVVIIFIPQTDPNSSYNCSEKPSRSFFKKLALDHNKSFIDLTDALKKHEYKYYSLYPHDFHLSRFGNYIVDEELSSVLKKFTPSMTPNPSIIKSVQTDLGHFSYSQSKSLDVYGTPSVRINQIGIRSEYELSIPKRKLRVGCFGDSFTFGHGVLDSQTYPHILSNLNQDLEILNFGVPGTTIVSHLDLLGNIDDLGLDLIIIQFGDNDLIDLMSHRQEIFSRIKPTKRSKEETFFLRTLGEI